MTFPRLLLSALLVPLVGCTTVPKYMQAFQRSEKTTFHTASMRVDAVRAYRSKATGGDTPDQQQIVTQLAQQIQVEPDPLVRVAIIDTLAAFRTPQAATVIELGLGDEDVDVRRHCCRALGERGDPAGVPVLARVINSEPDLNVRVAAVDALGEINSPDAYTALAVAMEDRDPALQYAGVKSMKSISGQDFGGRVESYLQYARGQTPTNTESDEISVAGRVRDMMPF
ncbi:HEAT repeat domain-containing protein [Aeoliella mucimassa]|uniref:PBS lyase HEAT-like repeat protein n=1 Tax=Aeoliella mucimassa TaxID=2527972 RepID=A0A518AI17_9BACT|nr:HEAT repeat domain-containing protein [Aeoliella mucimassa]QDU54355.1 PBS lyase HEAT-like repeat protein [Aeoliella mucimassa]